MYKTLEKYLEAEQVTVRDLADRIGVTPVTIYRYIDGDRQPRPEIAFKLSEECNIPFDCFYK
jgi:transcriptional regulator with XRE-family HTH domain